VTTFGTDTLLIRDLARSRLGDDDRIQAATALQLWLSVGFILLNHRLGKFPPRKFTTRPYQSHMVCDFTLTACFFLSFLCLAARLGANGPLSGGEPGSGCAPGGGCRSGCPLQPGPAVIDLAAHRGASHGSDNHRDPLQDPIKGFHFRLHFEWRQVIAVVRLAWPLAFLSILGVAYQGWV